MIIQIDLFQSVLDVGGVIGLLLLVAVGILWKKLDKKEAELAEKNNQIAEEGKHNIKIITSTEILLEKVIDELGHSEKRIQDSVTREAVEIKHQLHGLKETIEGNIERAKQTGQ